MPARNALKQYIAEGYYHLYNRGVEKRIIFQDEQDYAVFLHLLKECLSPPPELDPTKINPVSRINLYGQVALLCFVLMPNHFHLFVQQKMANGIERFMRSILTRYVSYFNRKYKRQGHLFQGRYKAILIETEPYFLHLSRYIHLNPQEQITESLSEYPYSSYSYYLGKRKAVWLNTDMVLSYFSNHRNGISKDFNSYQSFVENCAQAVPEELCLNE